MSERVAYSVSADKFSTARVRERQRTRGNVVTRLQVQLVTVERQARDSLLTHSLAHSSPSPSIRPRQYYPVAKNQLFILLVQQERTSERKKHTPRYSRESTPHLLIQCRLSSTIHTFSIIRCFFPLALSLSLFFFFLHRLLLIVVDVISAQ